MNVDLPLIAWISFRAAYSIVFINAAWQCGKNRAGIEWTIAEASILFGRWAKFLGPIGIFVMGAGGLSILLGCAAEVGGLLLALFLPLGAVIHLRQRDRAVVLADEIKAYGSALPSLGSIPPLAQLQTSAALGHYSSAIKNWSLLGPAIFFAVMGSGPLSVLRLWGLWSR